MLEQVEFPYSHETKKYHCFKIEMEDSTDGVFGTLYISKVDMRDPPASLKFNLVEEEI